VKHRGGKEDILLIQPAEKNKWRKCPGCKYYVEKKSRCLHVLDPNGVTLTQPSVRESKIDCKPTVSMSWTLYHVVHSFLQGNLSDGVTIYANQQFLKGMIQLTVPILIAQNRCMAPCQDNHQYIYNISDNISRRVRQANEFLFVQMVATKNWKQCPSCKFYVERRGGCRHMICRCGSQFCYVCGAKSCKSVSACVVES
ncbi:hypothetical protein C5167_041511, partial [Papaver somniferum]